MNVTNIDCMGISKDVIVYPPMEETWILQIAQKQIFLDSITPKYISEWAYGFMLCHTELLFDNYIPNRSLLVFPFETRKDNTSNSFQVPLSSIYEVALTNKQNDKVAPNISKINERFHLEDLFKAMRVLNSKHNEELFRALHLGLIMNMAGQIMFITEDVGRHNVLYKLIGWASLNLGEFRNMLFIKTGRVSVTMVDYAFTAGVRILVSTSKPTIQAFRRAKNIGLTLLGDLSVEGLNIYNDVHFLKTVEF